MDRRLFLGVISAGVALPAASRASGAGWRNEPLQLWNDGAAKRAILGFIAGATREGDEGYVPPEERTAVGESGGARERALGVIVRHDDGSGSTRTTGSRRWGVWTRRSTRRRLGGGSS